MIDVYTDGSCPRNSKAGARPGGWAFAYELEGGLVTRSGAVPDTTNNRMEMRAVLEALRHFKREWPKLPAITVYSDSQYVVNGLNLWGEKWQRFGWKRLDYHRKWQPISNDDLWKKLYPLFHDEIGAKIKWVRGHRGTRLNEVCDELAGRAVWDLIEHQ